MSQFYYGSICLEDLFGNLVQQTQDGGKWVNLAALPHPFVTGQKNGKHYVPVNVWVNDETDQFGNCASISVGQSKEERERKDKRVYIGNMKTNKPSQQYAPQGAPKQATAQTPWGQPQQPQQPAFAPQAGQQAAYYPPQGAAPQASPQAPATADADDLPF